MRNSTERASLDRRQTLLLRVLQYVAKHPDAKDTVEGILRFWLPREPIAWSEEELQQTLELLNSKGWLVKRDLLLSQNIYSLNRGRIEEIKTFLKEFENQAAGTGA
jgi:hypothetical protein